MSRTSTDIRGDAHSPSSTAPAGVTPARAGRRTVTPARSSSRSKRWAAYCGGLRWKRARLATVRPWLNGQPAQRPDPRGDAVVGGRAAAQAVEARLVADHPPVDRRQAAAGQHPREPARLGAAEARIAAAAQVEVAGDHARRVEVGVTQHLGVELALGAVAGQGRGGRVELVDRGRHARHVGRARVERRRRCRGRRRRRRRRPRPGSSGGRAGVRWPPGRPPERRARGARRAAPRGRRSFPSASPNPGERRKSRRCRPASDRTLRQQGWATSWSSKELGGRAAVAGGGPRPRSCWAAAGSPAASTRSARCARSTCWPSTGPSTSSTSTSARARAR